MFLARLFLALGWTRAAVEKLFDSHWWSGDYLSDFIAEQQAHMLPFARPLLDDVDTMTAVGISLIVLLAEAAIGLAFLSGRRLGTALGVATALNVSFISSGVVTPSAFYLVLQLTLLLALWLNANRPRRRTAYAIAAVCGAASLAMLPFIATLHPDHVIEDPAIMLATVAGLAAATCLVVAVEAPGQVIDIRTPAKSLAESRAESRHDG